MKSHEIKSTEIKNTEIKSTEIKSTEIKSFLEESALVDAAARWRQFVGLHRVRQFAFEECKAAWQMIFENWEADRGPVPCWVPSERRIQAANISEWMRELDFENVSELHEWSIQHRSEFWEFAVSDLEIAFRSEPDQILDDHSTIEKPNWLPNAKLNIVESCFGASDDQVAMIAGRSDNLEFYTYRDLRIRVNQVSNALLKQGFSAGDAIGVVMPIHFESVAIYLGIIQAGMVAVSIADSFAVPEISSRLRIANAKAVFTFQKMYRSGKEIVLGDRVSTASDVPVFFADQAKWVDLCDFQGSEFEPFIASPHDPINILFSSGTTGDPKAIPWNHTTPIKCATDGLLHHDLKPGDVTCWPTNLGWMMGPWLIFASLINKCSIAVYDDAPFGSGFGEFVQQANVNMLGVVPSIVRIWKADTSAESMMQRFDWSGIKVFSSTGEASSRDDMFYLSWLAGFKPIIEYCGGTEIGGGYISSTVVQCNAPATFSTPSFGLDVAILDDNHRPADEGELYLLPPSIGLSTELINRDHFETYFAGCPRIGGNPLRRHGDYFRRLGGGYFAAGGRADDTMNLGGIKVSSIEIEKILNSMAEVAETAAVAVPLKNAGPDQLIVFYVQAPVAQDPAEVKDENELLNEMNQIIRSELNPLFKIRKIIRKETLPRTASNKVMRRVLRSEWGCDDQ